MALEHRKMAQERWQRVFLLFALCGLLSLAVGWLAVGLGSELQRNLEQAQRIEDSSNEVRRLQQTVVDLETGQRGFLLTGDSAYLQPFEAAVRSLPMLKQSLQSTVAEDAAAAELLARIEHLSDAKLSEIEQALALQREQGRDAALSFMRTDVGKSLMDQIREHSEALIALQQRKLADLRQAVPVLVQQRDTTLLVLVVLGLLAGLAAFWSLRRHLVLLRREVELREQASRAVRENSEKSLFLANLSHEIRTPMNAIFGFTQLLDEMVTGERPRFYVKAIQASGKALLDLINDILDISKIEAGKLEVRPTPTDLRELMSLLNTVFAQMAMEKGLRLSIVVDDRLPHALWLDPTRLRQVLFNLVGNAIRYTDQGSVEVRICVTEAEQCEERVNCQIEVRDTGIGISSVDRERIFEPFTQLDNGVQERRGGTGLGLAIVHRLVKLMEGLIEVESVGGEGSVFRLNFPRVAVSHEPLAVAVTDGRLEDLPPLKIVAVDDIQLNRELLDHLFENTPHQLHLASGGAQGVAMTIAEHPDLVLMDIRMPEVDGREALRRIRAIPELADVVVVAVTASSLLDEENTLRSMFDGYVRKPITRQDLHAELARLFAKPGSVAVAPAASAATTQTAEMIIGLSASDRETLLGHVLQLDKLSAQAIATFASIDVTACVRCAQRIDALLVGDSFQHIAERVEAAASLFDLEELGRRLAALAAAGRQLHHELTESAA